MKSLFGSDRSPLRRKSKQSSSQQASSRTLMREAARRQEEERRNRNRTFMKYSSKPASSRTLSKTREHAKRLADSLPTEVDSPMSFASTAQHSFAAFADFNSAFQDSTSLTAVATATKSTSAQHSFSEEDLVATTTSSLNHDDSFFQASWPSEDQTMQRVPKNSSMQSTSASSTARSNPASATSPTVRRTPTSLNWSPPPVAASTTPSKSLPTTGTAVQVSSLNAGAAARRNMRRRMQKQDNVNAPPPVTASRSTISPQPLHQQVRRGSQQSSSLAESSSFSEASSSEVNIFDSQHGHGGFTFDAFGLDAQAVSTEVDDALQAIASHQQDDLEFFADRDPDDDAFMTDGWDQDTPNTSRSATPVEGFVDGFRVTKQQNLPPFRSSASQSPSSTERTVSQTTASTEESYHPERINMFKEKAGFASSATGGTKSAVTTTKRPSIMTPSPKMTGSPRHSARRLASSPQKQRAPSIPSLDEGLTPGRKSQDEVEFYMSDDSEPRESRPTEQLEGSENGTTSDVAFASDVGVSSDAPEVPVAAPAIPAEVASRSPKRRSEEKKDDITSPRGSTGNLRSKFESLTASSKAQERPRIASPAKQDSPVSTYSVASNSSPKATHSIGPGISQKNEAQSSKSPSVSSLRDRLESPKAAPKSFGGSSARQSHVSAALSRMPDRKTANKDVKSEIGEVSPPFHGVQLRKTARPASTSVEPAEPQRPTTSTLPRAASQEEASPPPRKLTYREQRELELGEQACQSVAESAEWTQPPQKDVASLIKQRVAANKQAAQETSNQPASVDTGAGLSGVAAAAAAVARRVASPTREKSDLVIEKSPERGGTAQEFPKLAASKTISHLLELQARVPIAPAESTTPSALSIDTGDHDNRDESISPGKQTTPKATMMMLNAFLAGKTNVTSPKSSVGEEYVFEADEKSRTTASSAPSISAVASNLPALKDDPQYAKYFKMLKIGMPMDVVKHAMERDGVDPSVMDGDHNQPVGIPLKDDPTYKKYFGMLKVGLPMEAVKHAMARDGLDPDLMDQDHNLPVTTIVKKLEKKEKIKKQDDSHRRARLHWKTLRKVTSNSLWAQIDQDDDLENIEIDEAEFQELFQLEKSQDAPEAAAALVSATKASKKGPSVRVIDPKRANNGGIVLARLKMSYDDMADAVDRIDHRMMNAEAVENIIEYLPSKEECKALENYMLSSGADAAEKFEGLSECEKFMVSMMTVKHPRRKVRALLFRLQFESCLEDIYNDAIIVESSCDELNHSVRLRKLLGIILTFGNRLNTAGSGEKRKAGAFTLDSLLKLNQAKAFDKKTTFLQYIVMIVQRNNEILLNFKDDLPTVMKADKVFWDQCQSDLEGVENELENVRRIALYQAHQIRAQHRARLRRTRKQEAPDDQSLSDDDAELTLEEEVEALRSTPIGMFTLTAIKYVSSLRDKVEQTKVKFARTLEYFGEDGANMQPHELFATLGSFVRDFEKAKEHVGKVEKQKKREERKKHATYGTASGKPSDGRPPAYAPLKDKPLRASSHQPSMSNVMKDLNSRSASKPRPDGSDSSVPVRPYRPAAQAPPPPPPPATQNNPRSSPTVVTSKTQQALRHKARLRGQRLASQSSS